MLYLLVLLLVLPLPAWALGDQEVLYVRPTAACTFNGTGTAYACAASNGAVGAKKGLSNVLWSATDATANTVDPNDILYICGTHDASQVSGRVRPTVDGNATDGDLIIDGDCPADPGTVDGMDVGWTLLHLDSRFYVTTRNLIVKRATGGQYAVSCYDSGQQDRDRFLTFDNITVRDNLNVTTAFWCWGANITVRNSFGINNSTDYFYFKGGREVTFTGNSCTEMSGPADCFQQDGTGITNTGTLTVTDNYCDKRGAQDIKYCYLMGPGNGPVVFHDNVAICPEPSINPSGCSPWLIDTKVDGSNNTTATISALRNHAKYGWRGGTILKGKNCTTPFVVQDNIFEGAGSMGLWLHSTVDCVTVSGNIFAFNGFLGTAAAGRQGIQVVKPNSTATTITGNVFFRNAVGLAYAGTITPDPTNNTYFAQTVWDLETISGGAGTEHAQFATDETRDPIEICALTYQLCKVASLGGGLF